jgi:hypothetical protein
MTTHSTAGTIVRIVVIGVVAVIATARTLSALRGSKKRGLISVMVSDSFKPQLKVYIA